MTPAWTTGDEFRRTLPFLVAIGFGFLLLPLQDAPIDWMLLAVAVAGLVGIVAWGALARSARWLPERSIVVLPYLFLLDIALVRDATGGILSGYGYLFFLAPFWVALYGSRNQLLAVTFAMFVVQAGQGLLEVDFSNITTVRRALLAAVIIGLISLAVQRNIIQLRRAERHLAAQSKELERSNRELEQFAYVSSHDLQEPLRMIRSFSQVFLQRHGATLDAEGRELIGFVTEGAERAQQLVNDLLEYSRVESEAMTRTSVPLDESLDRALATLDERVRESGAHIERVSLPTVTGDPNQLERLFSNLIGNAIKYREPDRPLEISVRAVEHDGEVEVCVQDNGIGLDNVHAERVFQMFQRLHGRDRYEGTGIGLAICAKIVERHGGHISAAGTLGTGASFTFTLDRGAL